MIRYAARTTYGFWTFVVAALVQTVNVAQRGRDWAGDVLWAADAQSIATFVVGPLLCAAVAVDTARYSDPGQHHLVRLSRAPRHPYVFTTLAAWLPVAVVHLAVGGAAVLAHAGQARPGDVAQAGSQLGVQALALLAFASLGSFLGRFVSRLAAGVLGVAAALGAFYVQASLGAGFQLLALGGATVPRLGLAYSAGYLLTQAAGLLVVATVLHVVPSAVRRGRAVPSVVAALAGLACLGALVSPLPGLPADRWLPDPRPPTDCSGSPTVCLYPEHRERRTTYGAAVERLVGAASAEGYDAFVPARVDELSRTYVPGARDGERVFGVATSSSNPPDDVDLVLTMVTPVHCPQVSAEVGPDQAYWDAHEALASTWLIAAGEAPEEVALLFGREAAVVLEPARADSLMATLWSCDIGDAGR